MHLEIKSLGLVKLMKIGNFEHLIVLKLEFEVKKWLLPTNLGYPFAGRSTVWWCSIGDGHVHLKKESSFRPVESCLSLISEDKTQG